jgi:hypothetical protein
MAGITHNGVTTFPCGRQECLKTAAGVREYRRRLAVMVERQLSRCAICLKVREGMQFDHADGRGHGGGHRDDSIWNEDGIPKNAALCGNCNTLKGSRRYTWIDGVYRAKEK